MSDSKDTTHKATKGEGTPNRGTLQSYVQNFTKESIDTLVKIMRDTSRENKSLRMGAAKALLDKSIPDVKAIEVGGVNGEPIRLNIISGGDYLSTIAQFDATSDSGTAYGSTAIQGTDLAPESEKDNDSNKSVSKVEST